VAAVIAVALLPGFDSPESDRSTKAESPYLTRTSEGECCGFFSGNDGTGTTGRSSPASAALWLSATTLLALLVIYFVGIDQGAVSVFGGDMHNPAER